MNDEDRIEIRGLRVLLFCGVFPHEQKARQPFELDLDLYLNLDGITQDSKLKDSVDYGSVVSLVQSSIFEEKFLLLETLAEKVCATVLADFDVTAVTTTVKKMRPPVEAHLVNAAVRMTRKK